MWQLTSIWYNGNPKYIKNTCLAVLLTETNKPISIIVDIAQDIHMAERMISTRYPLLWWVVIYHQNALNTVQWFLTTKDKYTQTGSYTQLCQITLSIYTVFQKTPTFFIWLQFYKCWPIFIIFGIQYTELMCNIKTIIYLFTHLIYVLLLHYLWKHWM